MTLPPITSNAWRSDKGGAGVAAHAGRARTAAERVEDRIGRHRIGQVDHPARHALKPDRHVGRLGERVGDLVGRQRAWQLMRKEPRVALVAGDGARRETVRFRRGDGRDQVAEVELAGDEMACQGVQELGMDRRVRPAHVVGRINQAFAEELRPNPVDGGPREVRIVG